MSVLLAFTIDGSQVDAVERLFEAAGACALRFEDAADAPALYDEGPPDAPRYWPRTRVAAFFLSAGAADFAASLLPPGVASTREAVTDAGWEREARKGWTAFAVSETLWVCPRDTKAPAGATALHLDPGLAFGSGTHPTTRLCLRFLQDRLARHPAARVLDFGCGSGILAIAALKLGARDALALDIDPLAIAATADNAEANGVGERLQVGYPPIPSHEAFTLVVANILAGPLLRAAEGLRAAVAPGGALALSGILPQQVDAVRAAFPDFALSVQDEDTWCLLAGGRA